MERSISCALGKKRTAVEKCSSALEQPWYWVPPPPPPHSVLLRSHSSDRPTVTNGGSLCDTFPANSLPSCCVPSTGEFSTTNTGSPILQLPSSWSSFPMRRHVDLKLNLVALFGPHFSIQYPSDVSKNSPWAWFLQSTASSAAGLCSHSSSKDNRKLAGYIVAECLDNEPAFAAHGTCQSERSMNYFCFFSFWPPSFLIFSVLFTFLFFHFLKKRLVWMWDMMGWRCSVAIKTLPSGGARIHTCCPRRMLPHYTTESFWCIWKFRNFESLLQTQQFY